MEITQPDPRSRPAAQQPAWTDDPGLPGVRRELAARPPLTRIEDIDRLRALLARVATRDYRVIMAGDCAEDPAECTASDVRGKAALVETLAGIIKMNTRRPVVRAGRIGGQFAKPRSSGTERIGRLELPVYRGHMVNAPEPVPELRAPAPERMLACYASAEKVFDHLWGDAAQRDQAVDGPLWTAHEALLLDYEIPMLRTSPDGRTFLASTHWPWIGDRTREPDGAHTALLSRVANPVACKIGPSSTVRGLLELCARLDPEREPGRLTLIARMGAGRPSGHLTDLVTAVREAGHPVIWLTDPMHGNTVKTPAGLKSRYVDSILQEMREFQVTVNAAGGVAGGLHLETTPENVTECVARSSEASHVTTKYTSLCDPRLNPEQAVTVASSWYQ